MAQTGLDRIKQAIIAPRSAAMKLAWMCGGLAGATGLRLALDRGAYGVPFLTFYPLILLTAIFLGGRYATMTAACAALIVNYVFLSAPWLAAENVACAIMLLLYLLTIGIIVGTGHVLRTLVLENEEHLRQSDAFNVELQHRTKNALQIMRSLIARGPRGEDPEAYAQNLAGRLDALAKANELLRFGALESCDIGALVASTLAPFDATRIHIAGKRCHVAKSATTPLVMALHELCTNATKYGALSSEGGQVSITWMAQAGDRAQAVAIDWREQHGPPVAPPTRRGLGSRVLVANNGLRAVELDWAAAGLVCRMRVDGWKVA